MALIWADRVLETSSTTGTGAFTLAGAVTGFQAFSSICSPSDTFHYMIEGIDSSGVPTGEWETGYGTYSAANTLTRTIVEASSNSGSAVSFSAGTKRVALLVTAAAKKFRGALVKLSADITGINATAGYTIGWTAETYDTDSAHDNTTNNSRLSVPSGVNYVRVAAQVSLNNLTAGNYTQLGLRKSGSSSFDGHAVNFNQIGTIINPTVVMMSPVLAVTGGTDYFEVALTVQSDTSVDITAVNSWFAIEFIG